MRIALGLEYHGANFCGWQSQPGGCGVQDTLEAALAGMAGHPVRTHAAGRTDAGVHALVQVVHFDTEASRPDTAWVRGVNSRLPPSLRVVWAQPVAEDFHARFCAVERSYQYLLQVSPVAPAILHGRVGWFHRPLDVEAMRQAAACLPGEHDFSAFRAAECQARSPVKHLSRADISRHGDFVLFEFSANAFLHHMVRNLVGCLVYVGKGEYPPQWLAEVLKSRDRTQAAPTFSAHGLYLSGVGYAPEWGLPECSRHVPL